MGALAIHKRQGRSGKRGKSKGRLEKVLKCYWCHKTGHFMKDCPLQKKDKGGEERDSIGTVSEGEESDKLLVVLEELTMCNMAS